MMRAPLLAHSARRTHYPCELRDPVDGRRVRARSIAGLEGIADCCAAWEILSPEPQAEPMVDPVAKPAA